MAFRAAALLACACACAAAPLRVRKDAGSSTFHADWVGDGYCDKPEYGEPESFEPYNTEAHAYDGGDCCKSTCKNRVHHSCGSNGYACTAPHAAEQCPHGATPSTCWADSAFHKCGGTGAHQKAAYDKVMQFSPDLKRMHQEYTPAIQRCKQGPCMDAVGSAFKEVLCLTLVGAPWKHLALVSKCVAGEAGYKPHEIAATLRKSAEYRLCAKCQNLVQRCAEPPSHGYAKVTSGTSCEYHGLLPVPQHDCAVAASAVMASKWTRYEKNPALSDSTAHAYQDVVDGCSLRMPNNNAFHNPPGTCKVGAPTPPWVPRVGGRADCRCSEFQPCICMHRSVKAVGVTKNKETVRRVTSGTCGTQEMEPIVDRARCVDAMVALGDIANTPHTPYTHSCAGWPKDGKTPGSSTGVAESFGAPSAAGYYSGGYADGHRAEQPLVSAQRACLFDPTCRAVTCSSGCDKATANCCSLRRSHTLSFYARNAETTYLKRDDMCSPQKPCLCKVRDDVYSGNCGLASNVRAFSSYGWSIGHDTCACDDMVREGSTLGVTPVELPPSFFHRTRKYNVPGAYSIAKGRVSGRCGAKYTPGTAIESSRRRTLKTMDTLAGEWGADKGTYRLGDFQEDLWKVAEYRMDQDFAAARLFGETMAGADFKDVQAGIERLGKRVKSTEHNIRTLAAEVNGLHGRINKANARLDSLETPMGAADWGKMLFGELAGFGCGLITFGAASGVCGAAVSVGLTAVDEATAGGGARTREVSFSLHQDVGSANVVPVSNGVQWRDMMNALAHSKPTASLSKENMVAGIGEAIWAKHCAHTMINNGLQTRGVKAQVTRAGDVTGFCAGVAGTTHPCNKDDIRTYGAEDAACFRGLRGAVDAAWGDVKPQEQVTLQLFATFFNRVDAKIVAQAYGDRDGQKISWGVAGFTRSQSEKLKAAIEGLLPKQCKKVGHFNPHEYLIDTDGFEVPMAIYNARAIDTDTVAFTTEQMRQRGDCDPWSGCKKVATQIVHTHPSRAAVSAFQDSAALQRGIALKLSDGHENNVCTTGRVDLKSFRRFASGQTRESFSPEGYPTYENAQDQLYTPEWLDARSTRVIPDQGLPTNAFGPSAL